MFFIQKAHAAVDYTALYGATGVKAGLVGGTLGNIIGTLLPYALTIAGLILFAMLVSGGFTMLAGASDKNAMENGKKTITNAFMGFIILFLSYWIAQILQVVFKVNIIS